MEYGIFVTSDGEIGGWGDFFRHGHEEDNHSNEGIDAQPHLFPSLGREGKNHHSCGKKGNS